MTRGLTKESRKKQVVTNDSGLFWTKKQVVTNDSGLNQRKPEKASCDQ
jgi:hypothetical protein